MTTFKKTFEKIPIKTYLHLRTCLLNFVFPDNTEDRVSDANRGRCGIRLSGRNAERQYHQRDNRQQSLNHQLEQLGYRRQ